MTMGIDWTYTKYSDLLSTQIEITRLSYDTNSANYAKSWEWSRNVVRKTKKDYIEPFIKKVRKRGVLLVVGCGTGRDLEVLGKMGFYYLGVDVSEGMLKEAVEKRGIRGPVLLEDLVTIKLVENSFDGILIDSAIEHVRKKDMVGVIAKLYKSLKDNGFALLRFRLGTGKVFVVNDIVGKRYFTSYSKDEAKRLIKGAGFLIVEEYCSDHIESNRLGFYTLIVKKKK